MNIYKVQQSDYFRLETKLQFRKISEGDGLTEQFQIRTHQKSQSDHFFLIVRSSSNQVLKRHNGKIEIGSSGV